MKSKFLAWKAWDKLCIPKACGGLGFKKTKDVNNALLAKIAWVIASKCDSLCLSILRAKYKKPSESGFPNLESHRKLRNIIVEGACYFLGSGTSINIWQDPWVSWLQHYKPEPRKNVASLSPLMVSQLIDQNLHAWKANLVQDVFDSKLAEAILSIPIPSKPKLDKLIWVPNPKGIFLVKSAYNTATEENHNITSAEFSWKKSIENQSSREGKDVFMENCCKCHTNQRKSPKKNSYS